ncbi:MAG: hypothetical protein AAGD32_17595 [Planctomycetota bacterium]
MDVPSEDNAPQPTDAVPHPDVPTGLPVAVPERLLGSKHQRMVLFQDEYDFFIENWNDWFDGEGAQRFTHKEDRDDIETICLYKVLEFRALKVLAMHPDRDMSRSLAEYRKIIQKARENLAARRADRVGVQSSKDKPTVNIAVIAGMPETQRKQVVNEKRAEELEALDKPTDTVNFNPSGHAEIDMDALIGEDPVEVSTGDASDA